jgi:hypothetical protein
LTLTCRGRDRRLLSANIFPATLKTEVVAPNGNSSVTPGLDRHHFLSEAEVIYD